VVAAPAKNIKLPTQCFRNNVRELGLGTSDIDIAEAYHGETGQGLFSSA